MEKKHEGEGEDLIQQEYGLLRWREAIRFIMVTRSSWLVAYVLFGVDIDPVTESVSVWLLSVA